MAPQVQEDVTFIYHFLPFSYILVAISDLIDPQSPNIPMPPQVQEGAFFAIFCYLHILEAIVELFLDTQSQSISKNMAENPSLRQVSTL